MRRRNANGEGTITRRRDGRWEARATQADGKRKCFYGATRHEVDDKLLAARHAQKRGLPIADDRASVGEFLTQWLEAARPSLRSRTWERYAELVRLHVAPVIGRTPLARLSPQQLQRLYARKLSDGLSPTTVHHVHAVVHRALAQAERWGAVARNVASLVDAPRIATHEMATLNEQEVRRLAAALEGHPLEAVFVLAFTTGMRLGEILGLRWRDVEREGEIHLRTTIERDGDEVIFVEPKTKGSRRRILLTTHASAALRRHRVRQAQVRLAAGPAWIDHDLVFSNAIGGPLPESTLRVAYRAALAGAGLPRIRFHDLRHTAATIALGRGVHPKVVSEMLGHSRTAITLDLYSHVTPTMQREAVSAMEAALGGR
ncbi:MAG TPA: site-specific integrase [Candidatus Limnocylindria bacterium]|nr:site-specific integrase [Candidatus Limnocylindria bacterium]